MHANEDETISIIVNGEPAQVPPGLTVTGLLRHLTLDPSRVAVELNREIVRRPAWNTTPIEAGARLEVVQFVGGG